MITIQDVHEEKRTIVLDDRNYVGCSYKDCTLLYSGGDFGWTDTKFEGCQVKLMGPAGRTMGLMKALNMIPDPDKLKKLNKLPLRH